MTARPTTLEERLRRDLAALADHLVEQSPDAGDARGVAADSDSAAPEAVRTPIASTSVVPAAAPPSPARRSSPRLLAAAAVLIVVVVAAVLVGTRSDDTTVAVETATSAAVEAPTTFGTWHRLAAAPIAPRAYAVTAWTGTEAIFWAGSSVDRHFAHTDGAAYDPVADTWRRLTVPGWGHPGLTSTYFDHTLYVLAKGFGSTLDLDTGTETELPRVESMYAAGLVAAADAVWALGPMLTNPAGQPDLGIVRHDVGTNRWTTPTIFEGTAEQVGAVQGLVELTSPPLWTGAEIVVWNGSTGGLAFDPDGERWRNLPLLESAGGSVTASIATVTDLGLTVVAELATAEGPAVEVATLRDDQWEWSGSGSPREALRVADFGMLTVASASDWIVLLTPAETPVTFHVPSGAWVRHDDSGLIGVQAPNTAWTGRELIVWGGSTDPAADPTTARTAVSGAIWLPPTE